MGPSTHVAFRDNYSSTLYSPQWTELARESIKLVLDAVKKTENWAAKESCLQLEAFENGNNC